MTKRLSSNKIKKIRSLKIKGFKIHSIAKLLSISDRTVLRHTRDIPHPKRKIFVIKKNVDTMTIDKAKILGYLAAEGCEVIGNYKYPIFDKRRGKAYRMKVKQHRIFFTNKNTILRNDFVRSVENCYGYRPYENGVADFVINARAVVNDLIKYGRFGSRRWFVPRDIVNSHLKTKTAWLMAYFDGDGSVDSSKKAIFSKSVNKIGLEQVKSLLNSIGIKSHILGPYDGAHVLIIDNKELYANQIGFITPKKLEKLNKILSN